MILQPGETYSDAITRLRREIIREALESHEGRRDEAAQALGIGRTYLQRLIQGLEDMPKSAGRRPTPPKPPKPPEPVTPCCLHSRSTHWGRRDRCTIPGCRCRGYRKSA